MAKKIAIVEDEAELAGLIDYNLLRGGFQTQVFNGAGATVSDLEEWLPDLIVLDVMLPKKDGFQVCRELRRAGVRTLILMLTAKSQELEKVMGLDLGADDYVTKPFSPLELRARIRALLRRDAAEQPQDRHAFGDVEVDFRRGEVRRSGALVSMTPLEFKLLGVFVKNRGRVLTRERLLNLAWGVGTFVSERGVDNYIVALRKKLEPDPSAPRFLINVRGQGYRFDG